MMYATRCTSIRDNKDISDGEKDKQIGELNVWLAKLIEPQALKSQVPTSVPPPPKQPAKGKESGTPSKVSPPMTPPPQAELKPPQGECGEQSAAVLMRKPRAFVPIYRALLGQLKFENDETDLTTLVKRGSRIRHTSGDYARPENLIQEARFTVICLEQEGELKLETLGPSTYENLPYENQRIVFRNR
jgi:type IV secretory pathway VirB10-like protein